MRRIVWLLCLCAVFLCACTNREAEPPAEGAAITVAVPANDMAVIGKYFDEYGEQSGVNFKMVDVPGDSEDVHRFYISASLSDKFNIDMYLMEDKWVKEFASCGYLEEVDLPPDTFIPVAQEAARYEGRYYAVPLYADAYAEFVRRSSASDALLYLEESAEDYLAGVESVLRGGGVGLAEAVERYESSARSADTDDFLFGEYGRAKGWLGEYDVMRGQHAAEASDVSIHIEKDALLRTKVFAIRRGTEHKKEILDILGSFFEDTAQRRLMEEKTAVPVLKSFYRRDDLYDITPHILNMDGLGFTGIEADKRYAADIKELGQFLDGREHTTENKLDLVRKLMGK